MITDSRTITIFLASSEELMNDRNAICVMIKEIDEILEPQGIRIYCKRWEDFIAHCTGNRTQDDYDRVLQNCDICLCLFHHKAGQYTVEEFKEAIKAYKKIHKPLPLVYMRDTLDGDTEDDTLKEFKNELSTQGDSWENYANVYELQEMFLQRLGQFMIENKLQSDISNIKVESGTVLYNGCEIANVSGLDEVVSENTRTITIFLASSNELDDDCMCFRYLVASLDSIYEPRGIRIRCRNWKKFNPNGTEERKQSEYDTVTNASDISICMFHREANKNTLDEFYQSLDAYNRNGDHPKTYVYIRALVDGEIEDAELAQFKKDLYDNMGHYWCNYATEDYMRLHFVMQFERLLNGESIPGGESNLKVQQGNLLLYGKKIADYANIPFAANNADMNELREKIVLLDLQISELQANGASQKEINVKRIERIDCLKNLNQMETQLLDIALSINKMISGGNPISERKRRAVEMFEHGKHNEADLILNAQDIKADSECSHNRLALVKQKKAEFAELLALMEAEEEKEIQNLHSYVDEYILKAKNVMTMFSNPNRLDEACHWYEEAITETRRSLFEVDLAGLLSEYAHFLYAQRKFDESLKYNNEALSIYKSLDSNGEYAVKSAELLTLSAHAYYEKLDFELVIRKCDEALSLYQNLSKNSPQQDSIVLTLQMFQACTYGELGLYEKAIKTLKTIIQSYNKLIRSVPYDYLQYKQSQADAWNALGTIYVTLYSRNITLKGSKTSECLIKAERAIINSIKIYQQLDLNNSCLALQWLNLAGIYEEQSHLHKAERKYANCISILRDFKDIENMKILCDALQRRALLFASLGRFEEAYADSEEVLLLYPQLLSWNKEGYSQFVARILCGIGVVYSKGEGFKKAKQIYKKSLELYHELVNSKIYKDAVYEWSPAIANVYWNLGELYRVNNLYENAKKEYWKSLKIYSLLSKTFPFVNEYQVCMVKVMHALNKLNPA